MRTILLATVLATSSLAFGTGYSADSVAGEGAGAAYAQVCIRNTGVGHAMGLRTQWGVGDNWHRVVLGCGTEMIYRLNWSEVKPEVRLSVRYQSAPGSREVTTQVLSPKWTAAKVDNCKDSPSFEFVKATNERGEVIYTLTPVQPEQE